MQHTHAVRDADSHFVICTETRQIRHGVSQKYKLIQHDHNSERLTFTAPRYIEGHDMSLCDTVQIHYRNIDTRSKAEKTGIYEVSDMMISEKDEQMISFSWLIGSGATSLVGALHFLVRFACTDDDGAVTYAWNTAIDTDIMIMPGMSHANVGEDGYSDLLRVWKAELDASRLKNITQTVTSTAAGGVNIWTAEFYDGRKQYFEVRNGSGSGGGEETALPSYWLIHLEEKADLIRTAMENAGRQKSAFLFYTDAHWTANSRVSPMLLSELCKKTPVNRTIFGGDIVGEESDEREGMRYLWEWRAAVRGLPHHYSVPGNHDNGNHPDARFDENYVYTYLQAAEEEAGIVRDSEGLWYYLDVSGEQTRYLFLDTGVSANSDVQAEFVVNALKSTPSGWHIVVVAHIWLDNDYTEADAGTGPVTIAGIGTVPGKYLALFDAYNARQSGSITVKSTAVSYNFVLCGARVEFCIGGHTHVDNAAYASESGIPVIVTESDCYSDRSGLSDDAGTLGEAAVSAVVADYGTKTLHVFRIGRGSDFTVSMNAAASPEPPEDLPSEDETDGVNLIPLSVDTENNIFNGVGYKDEINISNADGVTEVHDSKSWVTGYMPIKRGDVVSITNYFNKDAFDGADYTFYVMEFYDEGMVRNRFKYVNQLLLDMLEGNYTWTGEGSTGTLTFTFDGTSSMFENARWFRLTQTRFVEDEARLNSIATASVIIN